MKIKQVCEATGLTDRAIRYYIEEELLSPSYTENYMGRRAYDFTEEDVAALNHVATLRKFGFTVEEIRRILTDPQESIAVLTEVRARKEETLRQEGENLDALSRLEAERAYTVAELALALAEPVQAAKMPREDWLEAGRRWTIRLVRRALLCVLAMLPVIMLLRGVIVGSHAFHYPVIRVLPLLRTAAIVLLPTMTIGLLCVLKRRRQHGCRSWATKAALVLCVLYLPVSLVASRWLVDESETSSVMAYRRLDTQCELNNDVFFQELFPAVRGTKQPVYHYYYERGLFPTYDVTAEWRLPPEELAAEVTRVTQLFSRYGDYDCFEQGGFTCLTRSWHGGVQTMAEKCGDSVMAFAHNEQTGQVRYIAYYSDAGLEPYYLTLEWGEEELQ